MATPLDFGSRSVAIGFSLLCFLPLAAGPAVAQVPDELSIVVVQGEGAINHVRQAVASEPVIRVEDENQKPITGATVLFSLPTEGATGHFGNGGKILTLTTDAQGKATATGIKVNEYPGKLVIHVSVSYRGLSARTNITQFDEGPPVAQKSSGASGGGHGKLVAILAIVGAAAGGGAYYATHRGGTATSGGGGTTNTGPAAIGLTAGTPTITGPH